MTADSLRPVQGYFWSRDSKAILFVQDQEGNENYHVYAVDPAAEPAQGLEVPAARDLTPLENVRAAIYAVPENDPVHVLIGLNDRDPAVHDVYRVDIRTGERSLVLQNDENVAQWGGRSRWRPPARNPSDRGERLGDPARGRIRALREKRQAVEYLLAANEGHGFANKDNNLAMFAKIEQFLATHLGGRYQEGMPPEIRETLDELTVDVETVAMSGVESK